MKITAFLALVTTLWLAACTGFTNDESTQGYVASGTITGLADSTLVTIGTIDSIYNTSWVINDRFEMRGFTKEIEYVKLRVNDSRSYKSFWLENANIEIKGSVDDLKASVITGSDVQLEYDVLYHSIDPIRNMMSELRQSYRRIPKSDSIRRRTVARKLDSLLQERFVIERQYVRDHPDSPISIRILDIYKTQWALAEVKALYERVPLSVTRTRHGRSVGRFLELVENLDVGDEFVDFTMPNDKTTEVTFSNLRGKYTMLEFWASWCAPCRHANPELKKIYELYHPAGFEIVGISLDNNEMSWKSAIAEDQLDWPQLSDLKGNENKAALIYGVSGIPDNILIGPDGKIISRNLEPDRLKKLLNSLLLVP